MAVVAVGAVAFAVVGVLFSAVAAIKLQQLQQQQ